MELVMVGMKIESHQIW